MNTKCTLLGWQVASFADGQVDRGQFVELNVANRLRLVVVLRREEAWQHATAQQLCTEKQRSFSSKWLALGPNACRLFEIFSNHAGRHCFVDPPSAQYLANTLHGDVFRPTSGYRHRNVYVFRDLFVAVDSGHFFDQVDLAGQVTTPAWWTDDDFGFRRANDLATELLQYLVCSLGRNFNS